MRIPQRRISKNRSTVGRMLLLEGMILLVPLLLLPFYRNEIRLAWIFILPSIGSAVLGKLLCRKGFEIKNSSRQVVFVWLYGILLASIPFLLYGGLTPVQALFEAVSGFTTTGLSVLDVEKLPKLMLFYRAFLQYVGGLGFVVTMLLFVQEKESAVLFQAEGHPDRLMPDIGKTARVIVLMYIFFLVIGTALYAMVGMPVFDSVVHTMCALSTGGFSNRMDSIGAYHSLSMEAVTILLMLIGTTNFSFLLFLFQGRFKAFVKASELRFLGGILLLAVSALALCLIADGRSVSEGIRSAAFHGVSAISTTGYATESFQDWPEIAAALMILLMIIGGGMGSTAGGIKLARVCILCKNLVRNVRKKLLPERTVILAYYHRGKEREILEADKVEEASLYAVCYLVLYCIGTICLTISTGCSLLEGAFEFASSIGTVGLSIGITNIQTGALPLLIEIIGMILGRLEIFVILKAFCRR